MQQVITTPAPIPVLELKRKFTEDVHFNIEYSKSKFKGKAFLTWLSNLKIDVDLLIESEEDTMELIAAYLELPVMLYHEALVGVIVNMLLIRNGLIGSVPFDPTVFEERHGVLLDLWSERLDCCPLFAALCVTGDSLEINAEQWPTVNETTSGINWVHCLNHPGMALYFAQERELRYSKHWFEERVFAGKNLYHYFESPDNVLFVSAATLVSPESHEDFKSVVQAHDNLLPELVQG